MRLRRVLLTHEVAAPRQVAAHKVPGDPVIGTAERESAALRAMSSLSTTVRYAADSALLEVN